jgi:ABC-type multidrug transport system ATPase subunit
VHEIDIILQNAGKKFGKEWIFRKLDLTIFQGDKLAILGLNGSGKSTLLQVLTGYVGINEGTLNYTLNSKPLDIEGIYKHISLASPYLELIEDFTLEEMIFHAHQYKPFINSLTVHQVIELSGLSNHQHKFIKLFSSGMKQRLKLTLAILADAPVLFLDEPTTNLDATVIKWYQQLIATYTQHKTIIVCSNTIKEEYDFCTKIIMMEDIKA